MVRELEGQSTDTHLLLRTGSTGHRIAITSSLVPKNAQRRRASFILDTRPRCYEALRDVYAYAKLCTRLPLESTWHYPSRVTCKVILEKLEQRHNRSACCDCVCRTSSKHGIIRLAHYVDRFLRQMATTLQVRAWRCTGIIRAVIAETCESGSVSPCA